ncbi:MAG: hypothetical protein WAN51_08140 [Alphaproteobacteria bacterium]
MKATLNFAFRDDKAASDKAWRRVRPYRDVDAPVILYLTEDEAIRAVNACDKSFRQLVRAALLTGCGYGEFATLKAADFNRNAGTITVRETKSGKPRHVVLTEEGRLYLYRCDCRPCER